MADDEVYNESMSLACQFGRCEDCPEAGETIGGCSCVCHIPDAGELDESDLLAQEFYERFYA